MQMEGNVVRLCEEWCCGCLLHVQCTPQGIRSGNVPYHLHTGVQGFWEWLNRDHDRAARFDMAMLAVNHFGGSAVVNTYSWGQFDCVVDVAGGVGGFMADLMTKVPQLKHGVVFDLAQNIQRAKKVCVSVMCASTWRQPLCWSRHGCRWHSSCQPRQSMACSPAQPSCQWSQRGVHMIAAAWH